jgi:hypothetical protein
LSGAAMASLGELLSVLMDRGASREEKQHAVGQLAEALRPEAMGAAEVPQAAETLMAPGRGIGAALQALMEDKGGDPRDALTSPPMQAARAAHAACPPPRPPSPPSSSPCCPRPLHC